MNRHEEVVKILLRRDEVNPDGPDNNGHTPLHCATKNGNDGVVKMVLRQDQVNPEKQDGFGETPLFCAASNGCEEVVKILDRVSPQRGGTLSEARRD